MEKLMKPDDVVKQLQCSKAALYRWVADGRIAAVRVGARLRFTEQAVSDFLESSASTDGAVRSSAGSAK
jgi:excisionase family DNA binding protein